MKLNVCLYLLYCQLEKGVDALFGSFSRLDSRISSVGQTAAKIGDHLQVKFCIHTPVLFCGFYSSLIFTSVHMDFACRVQMLSDKLLVKQ